MNRLAVSFLLLLAVSCESRSKSNHYTVLISEILPDNRSISLDVTRGAAVDAPGDSQDFIELFNPNDHDVDLGGYCLSVGNDPTTRWAIPAGTVIEADGYVVIRTRVGTENREDDDDLEDDGSDGDSREQAPDDYAPDAVP